VAQTRFNGCRDSNIAVVKKSATIKNDFKNKDGEGTGTNQENTQTFVEHRDYYFSGVKANSGARVNFQVGMMNAMKAPEPTPFMGGNMLQVNGKIKQQIAEQECCPMTGAKKIIYKSPVVFLCDERALYGKATQCDSQQ